MVGGLWGPYWTPASEDWGVLHMNHLSGEKGQWVLSAVEGPMGGGRTTTPVLTSNLGGSRTRHTGVPSVLLSMALVRSLFNTQGRSSTQGEAFQQAETAAPGRMVGAPKFSFLTVRVVKAGMSREGYLVSRQVV